MTNQKPAWDVAVVDGEPVQVINRAMVEQLIKESPLGETEARRRLRAAGYLDVGPPPKETP